VSVSENPLRRSVRCVASALVVGSPFVALGAAASAQSATSVVPTTTEGAVFSIDIFCTVALTQQLECVALVHPSGDPPPRIRWSIDDVAVENQSGIRFDGPHVGPSLRPGRHVVRATVVGSDIESAEFVVEVAPLTAPGSGAPGFPWARFIGLIGGLALFIYFRVRRGRRR
jgi:hypothetical protein